MVSLRSILVLAPDSFDRTFEVTVMEVEKTSVQGLSTAQDHVSSLDEYVSESFRAFERTFRRFDEEKKRKWTPDGFTFDSNEHAHPLIWAAPLHYLQRRVETLP